MGVYAAVRRNSPLDYFSRGVAALGQAVPPFWLGLVLVLIFGVALGLLPTSGRGTPALRCAVREIADIAAAHLHAARERRAAIPRSALAAVLPAIIADRFLARLRRAQYDPFAPALVAPDPLQIWRLAFAALVGRF